MIPSLNEKHDSQIRILSEHICASLSLFPTVRADTGVHNVETVRPNVDPRFFQCACGHRETIFKSSQTDQAYPSLCVRTQPQAHKDPGAKVVVLGNHCMYVKRVLDDPRVARVDGFVTDEEADHLISIAHERGLKPSHVVCVGFGSVRSLVCSVLHICFCVLGLVCGAGGRLRGGRGGRPPD